MKPLLAPDAHHFNAAVGWLELGNRGEALMLLGQHWNRQQQPDKAILYYERAARLESFAANAKVKIAQVYVGQGRCAEALPLLRDAQALKPREDVARYIEQVERASKSKR